MRSAPIAPATRRDIELARDGRRVVYHRRGRRAWTHPADRLELVDAAARDPSSRVAPCLACGRGTEP